MAKIHALAEFQESSCPACGASINAGAKSRKRKVQCPKCREVVELGKAEPVAKVLPDAGSVRLAELEARLERLEALEARVAALECATPSVAIVPFPEPKPAPAPAASPARKLRWIERSERHRGATLPPEVREALAHNLSTLAAGDVTLRAAADDPIPWERALQLKAFFEHAQWRVHGPHPASPRPGAHGLALAVGSLPPSAEAAGIYLALTAAGFTLDSILDPSLGEGKAALVVG
jgi:hypothetical protein